MSDAIKYFARHYRVCGKEIPKFDITERVEEIDFPSSTIPLRSIGPDPNIISIDDDPSEAVNEEPIEKEGGEDDGGADEEAETKAIDEETLAPSSSRAHEETGAEAESAAPFQKRKRRKIIPMDPDEIPDHSGKEPCPYWQSFAN